MEIGDKVALKRLITWDEGRLEEGTEGFVANIIKGESEEYVVFNPLNTVEMYFVKLSSVTKAQG